MRAGAGAALRAELGFAAGEPVVLFLGTGYARKGLDLLIDAFPALLAREPRARLLVVGYDSARASFEQRARELGIAGRVTFSGGRADPEAWYTAADLYALPTRYDPAAYTTLEALASGLPVITSTTNGAGELIEPRVQGSLVDVAIVPVTGPEVVTGSTRMKAGTATKLVLNTITTAAMVRLGKVYGNLMVELQVTCEKLRDRGQRILMETVGVGRAEAEHLLDRAGGHVKTAIVMAKLGVDRAEARRRLDGADGVLVQVVGDLGTV